MHQKNISIRLRAVALSLGTLIIPWFRLIVAAGLTAITTMDARPQKQLLKWVLERWTGKSVHPLPGGENTS